MKLNFLMVYLKFILVFFAKNLNKLCGLIIMVQDQELQRELH